MTWMQKLYETYEECSNSMNVPKEKLWPLSHLVKKAHVEVAIDATGNFRRAKKLDRIEMPTLIPATESSAGRTSGIAPHPLCEEIGYCASDFPKLNTKKFVAYERQLQQWCESPDAHSKAKSIFAYVKKGRLWSDLSDQDIFPIFVKDAQDKKTKIADDKVFVRWRVEAVGDPQAGTWKDNELINAWASFDLQNNAKDDFCMVFGQVSRISQNHPRFVRSPGDGGKLISTNDKTGFTFRGRFTDKTGEQACGVGYDVTQKAHSALRWLIKRQGYRNGDQVIVAWAVSGKDIPDPFANSLELFGVEPQQDQPPAVRQDDAGQAFGQRLSRRIAGYLSELGSTADIVVMGLDSATPGRMAITFYRELVGTEFLERVQAWHKSHAWHQNYAKDKKFVGAPSPRDIAEAAYGHCSKTSQYGKLVKVVVERLLPCVIDGRPLPRDLMESTVRRACNRAGQEHWEWEKNLGIACALFKGYFKERSYQMTLEPDRTSRDYLYGRLLAIADHIEDKALYVSGEKRATNAARLMQRFADHPFSTWRTIELSLKPYETRLRAKRPPFLHKMELLLDDVISKFKDDDFLDDRKLSGEFLLAYHCQRQELWSSKTDGHAADPDVGPNKEYTAD